MSIRPKVPSPGPAPDIAGIAHDMRSPLSVIKAYLSLAGTPGEQEPLKELRLAAMRSVEKLVNLVEDLRRPPGAAGARIAHCDLAEIAQASLAEAAALAMERGVELRYLGPKALAARADGGLVGRAATNLVVNAVQAGQRGGEIRVALSMRRGVAFLEVADNGDGIDRECLPKIFERGFTHGKADGTGIGLDLCRQIAGEHGGALEVHSEKGAGAAFVLSLPWAPTGRDDWNDWDDWEETPAQLKLMASIHSGWTFGKRHARDLRFASREETLD